MMSVLGFVLACAAIAAFMGTALSVVVTVVLAPVVRRRMFQPGMRADLVFALGIVPALAAIATTAAAAAPSVTNLLGFAEDHCGGHAHAFHVCFLHSAGIEPALATVGAFALALWFYRTGALVSGIVQVRSQSLSLEGLGWHRPGAFPTFVLPGTKLCHATGFWRRRIMLSAEIEARLSPPELAGALAHEEAHLRRRDPLASFVLAAAGLFVPPALAARLRHWHREAAEEACDAAAAARVGDGASVAAALVKVASLQGGAAAALATPAFGQHALETRVRVLLEGASWREQPARWRALALLGASAFALLAGVETEAVHHAVEHALDLLF